MKRGLLAALSILAVAAGVGWKLASHPARSAELQEIKLNQSSEHSNPGLSNELAGIRFRLGPSDFGYAMASKDYQVPQVSLTE